MKTVEDFKRIIAQYYNRDEEAKKEYEEFVNGNGKAQLQKLFDSIPAIEKQFSLLLPQDYKTFVEAKVAWSLYGKRNEFRTYDEQEIYEFNIFAEGEELNTTPIGKVKQDLKNQNKE